jgi:hypothetical protein
MSLGTENAKALKWETLFTNNTLQKEAKVLIFCSKSYGLFNSDERSKTYTPSLVLLDECHLYAPITNKVFASGWLTVALSATPLEEWKNKTLYTLSRKASQELKITAPLIIDRLPNELKPISKGSDESNQADNFQQIARVLKDHYHPNGGKLRSYKGIIHVNSIEEAKLLKAHLERISELTFTSFFLIHSGNGSQQKNQETIKKFLAQGYNTASLAIVVGMLQTGYDDPNIMW